MTVSLVFLIENLYKAQNLLALRPSNIAYIEHSLQLEALYRQNPTVRTSYSKLPVQVCQDTTEQTDVCLIPVFTLFINISAPEYWSDIIHSQGLQERRI